MNEDEVVEEDAKDNEDWKKARTLVKSMSLLMKLLIIIVLIRYFSASRGISK